ncbi:MAG: carboxylating nicotinate-nucleotide diphosphorylase [Acidimicrobiales bacterium]
MGNRDSQGMLASTGYDPPICAVRRAVELALGEDLLPLGDVTAALIPADRSARLHIVSRQDGIVAGSLCAVEAFQKVDSSIAVDWKIPDGGGITRGSVVAVVAGPLRSILTAERTALNFLCHLSGVATLTGKFVSAVSQANRTTVVLDTRKTTPGLRALEKAAVRAGGGRNHRGNLSEAVLVKDNHLAGSSVADAVARAHEMWPFKLVEVECDAIEQAIEAQEAGAAMVLLDNMTPDEVASCVAALRSRSGGMRVAVEVSGGITLESAPRYAAAGVDFISVGALTHSAPAVDLGLDVPVGRTE